MRLIEIENHIKDLIKDDINNPEVYNEIFKLSYYYLMRRRLLSSAEYAEEVAHIMAEDLYIKILDGDTINSWLGYISKYYHGAIRTWRRMNSSEIIDTTGDLSLQSAIITMSTTSSNNNYDTILDNVYIDSVITVVDFVLDNSQYFEYTSEYLYAKLSILISLSRGYFVNYGLDNKEVNYVRLLYNKTKYSIIKGIKSDNCKTADMGLTVMQLYALSNIDLDE